MDNLIFAIVGFAVLLFVFLLWWGYRSAFK